MYFLSENNFGFVESLNEYCILNQVVCLQHIFIL